MRVTHITPAAFGEQGLFGGGERYPLELARALARHVTCRLITFGPRGGSFVDGSGVEVEVVRTLVKLKGHPAHPLGSFTRRLRGSDIVHAHQMRAAPTRVAAVAARTMRRPIVVTDHGLGGGGWVGLLPRLFDMFLPVSQESARTLASPPGKTRIVYGGCDPTRFHPDPSVTRRGVLFVGRLTPHKGVDRLLAALPPGVPLRIAGSTGHDPRPPERDYPALLRELAEGRDVEFLGPVPDDELPILYRQAAVLVLPSVERTCYGRAIRVSELLGLVVLEAMASGTPVICSRLGGLPEIVEHGVTGYLVAPGDVAELRERIAELTADPALAARLGRNARELVLARFTWRACAERCLAAYAELT